MCVYSAVTERHIYQAARAGAATLKDLRRDLGVTSECGRCAACAKQCLSEARGCDIETMQLLLPEHL